MLNIKRMLYLSLLKNELVSVINVQTAFRGSTDSGLYVFDEHGQGGTVSFCINMCWSMLC